jgi:hypothetical protein
MTESHSNDQKIFLRVDIERPLVPPIITNEGTIRKARSSPVQNLLEAHISYCSSREGLMSLVRLLGFTTLSCGCVVGRYRELATSREITYVEEKGKSCGSHGHRRNHTVVGDRYNVGAAAAFTKAS